MYEDFAYYRNLEQDWRKSLPRLSGKALLDAFPEALEIIPIKLKEWIGVKSEIEKVVTKKLKYIHRAEPDSEKRELLKIIIAGVHGNEFEEAERHIKRLKRLLSLSKNKKKSNKYLSEEDVETARNVPILDVARGLSKVKKVNGGYSACCCFHDDSTPSLKIYTKDNSFYCFGCGAGGNVISFVMKQDSLGFIDATRRLLGHD